MSTILSLFPASVLPRVAKRIKPMVVDLVRVLEDQTEAIEEVRKAKALNVVADRVLVLENRSSKVDRTGTYRHLNTIDYICSGTLLAFEIIVGYLELSPANKESFKRLMIDCGRLVRAPTACQPLAGDGNDEPQQDSWSWTGEENGRRIEVVSTDGNRIQENSATLAEKLNKQLNDLPESMRLQIALAGIRGQRMEAYRVCIDRILAFHCNVPMDRSPLIAAQIVQDVLLQQMLANTIPMELEATRSLEANGSRFQKARMKETSDEYKKLQLFSDTLLVFVRTKLLDAGLELPDTRLFERRVSNRTDEMNDEEKLQQQTKTYQAE